MPTWKKEFRGALIEASERRNNPATLKINGQAVEVQREGKNFVSPAAFGIFTSLEALSKAVIRQQQAQAAARPTLLVRRDIATLNNAMRDRFVKALLQMKQTGEYDRFAEIHHHGWSAGHDGPAFFPWHRALLLDFEKALQEADEQLGNDGLIALPYWNWTKDDLDGQGNSLIWNDDLLGGDGVVASGPFKDWGLVRRFGRGTAPGDNGVSRTMSITHYEGDDGFRDEFEFGPHGGAHVWVGGAVANPHTAANDPIFWLLHSNVDRCWAKWQNDRRRQWLDTQRVLADPSKAREPYPQDQLAKDYFYDSSEPNRTWPMAGHNLDDTMWPWNGSKSVEPSGDPGQSLPPWNQPGGALERRPRGFLDHLRLGYVYDTEIGWERVRDILDNILYAWEQIQEPPRRANLASHGGPWVKKQELLQAVAHNHRLVEAGVKGSQTKLVKSLRDRRGVFLGRMPLRGPFLSEHDIEEICLWIDAGCPD